MGGASPGPAPPARAVRAGPSPTRQPRAPRAVAARAASCVPPLFLRPRPDPERPHAAHRDVGPGRPPAPRAPALTVGGSRSPAQRLRLGLKRGGHAPPRAPSRRRRRPALAGTGGERRELTPPRTRRWVAPRGCVGGAGGGGRAPFLRARSTAGAVVPPGGRCRQGQYGLLPGVALQLPAVSAPREGETGSCSSSAPIAVEAPRPVGSWSGCVRGRRRQSWRGIPAKYVCEAPSVAAENRQAAGLSLLWEHKECKRP